MKREDKAIFKGLVLKAHDEDSGFLYAYAEYDVHRLWWVKGDMLEELLFQKTLKAYPFAIIERGIRWGLDCAYIEVAIFIPPGAVIRKVED